MLIGYLIALPVVPVAAGCRGLPGGHGGPGGPGWVLVAIYALIALAASALARSYGQFGRRFLGLTWCFAGSAGWRSGYFKVSGIGVPMSSKACRWVLVGSASIAMVTWVPVYRTWLRVSVARWSSRPRKLR